MSYLIVALGAGLGGAVRYWVSTNIHKHLTIIFPLGTFTANLIGSVILGILIFALDEKELVSSELKLFIGIGFYGGLTTFSTFSLETFNLIKETEFLLAGLNVLLNVILTLAGIYIGYLFTR
ncbi:MAG: fluoride efflux transporter CrcB [Bacteroidetes bacterium]|nr:fluoride efflux transporter CrcB [Bacteroidota bacterium]